MSKPRTQFDNLVSAKIEKDGKLSFTFDLESILQCLSTSSRDKVLAAEEDELFHQRMKKNQGLDLRMKQ